MSTGVRPYTATCTPWKRIGLATRSTEPDRPLEGQEEGSPQLSTGPSKPNRGDLRTDPGFWAGWDPMIHRGEDALAAHGCVVEVAAAGR